MRAIVDIVMIDPCTRFKTIHTPWPIIARVICPRNCRGHSAYEFEALQRFKLIGGVTPAIPGTDDTRNDGPGSMYRLESGTWVDHHNIHNGTHVRDFALDAEGHLHTTGLLTANTS